MNVICGYECAVLILWLWMCGVNTVVMNVWCCGGYECMVLILWLWMYGVNTVVMNVWC